MPERLEVTELTAPLGRHVDLAQGQVNTRNYIERVIERDRAGIGLVQTTFGAEYWDNDPRLGYGGYHYDGRWLPIATAFAQFYELRSGDRVLEIGCGKGYLLYELSRLVPGLIVAGLDISGYAIERAKDDIRDCLRIGDAADLPYENGSMDLVLALNTLQLLPVERLFAALGEMERVSRRHKYVKVESYRNEQEKYNFLNWQLWVKSFYSVEDWKYIFGRAGYRGDFEFAFYT